MTGAIEKRDADPASVVAPEGQGAIFAMAMLLTALAGWVDATGFIHFHGLFVSFMSGNSTQMMVGLAGGDLGTAGIVGRTILLFVLGVIVGESLAAISGRWGRGLVLILEVSLLGAALAASHRAGGEEWISVSLALAMGVQNAAIHEAEGIGVALTYVTGTLVHVGRGVAAALRGAGSWSAPLPFVGLWVGLVCGGLGGALVAGRSLQAALVVAAGVGLLSMLWALVTPRVVPGPR